MPGLCSYRENYSIAGLQYQLNENWRQYDSIMFESFFLKQGLSLRDIRCSNT